MLKQLLPVIARRIVANVVDEGVDGHLAGRRRQRRERREGRDGRRCCRRGETLEKYSA